MGSETLPTTGVLRWVQPRKLLPTEGERKSGQQTCKLSLMLQKARIIPVVLTVLVVSGIAWGLIHVGSMSLNNRAAHRICMQLTQLGDVHPLGGTTNYDITSGEWSCVWHDPHGHIIDQVNLGTNPHWAQGSFRTN